MLAMQVFDQAPDQDVAALLHHREQAHLILENVPLEFVTDRAHWGNEADIDAELFNLCCHVQQFRQGAAVSFVKPVWMC